MYRRRAPFHYPNYFYDLPDPSYIYPPLPTCRHPLTLPYVEHPSFYHDHFHQPTISPRIIQTNVRNDISYHLDDDFMYPNRSQMIVPEYPRYSFVSPIAKRRTVIVRDRSLPAVVSRPTRLVPLYHSADPQYFPNTQRRRVLRLRSLSP